MINLLPYEHKSEIRAARTNVILVRYIGIVFSAAFVLGGLVAGTYVSVNDAKAIAELQVKDNEQRVAVYKNTKVKADAFRSDLATAKAIYDNSISYSRLIYSIADTTPRNVILEDLPLNPSTFGTSMSMKASAKTFDDANKLEEAFRKNNQLFSKVELQSIKSETSSKDDPYPVKVTLSVVINKGAIQ